jgi:hypothetical protein
LIVHLHGIRTHIGLGRRAKSFAGLKIKSRGVPWAHHLTHSAFAIAQGGSSVRAGVIDRKNLPVTKKNSDLSPP